MRRVVGAEVELQIVLPNESTSADPAALTDLAQLAEQLGFAAAWLPDHVLPPGPYGEVFGGVYEPLVTIAHLAAKTTRLTFGTSVLVAPLRNPFVLAKQVATVQELSGGRVVLGIGSGWSEPEFSAVGADFAHRGAVTDDVLDLLRHLWSGGAAPYTARRYSHAEGVFAPAPTTPIPIMIGGNSDAALRRAARVGDAWQGMPTGVADFRERAGVLRELAGERRVRAGLRIAAGDSSDTRELVELVEAYRDAGAQDVAIHFGAAEAAAPRLREFAARAGGLLG